MNHNEEDSNYLFNLSISIDRDKYLRRTCPECGRDFKTEINEADVAWAIAPHIRRMGLEIGESPGADSEQEASIGNILWCPYCCHTAEASDMLTRETIDFLHKLVMREIVLPMTNKVFSQLDTGSSSFSGLLSINIEHHRSLDPVRPIHGPEPADMKIVEFLCCNKKGKISDNWHDISVCIFCGLPITLV